MAHDLLGIVSIIQGYAALVPIEPRSEFQVQYCGRILHACRRMTELVERSLSRSCQGAATAGSHPQQVDLRAFLGDCLAAQAINARAKDMELRLELSGEPATTSLDTGCVERILDNLLGNAIKFSHPGSTITLAARVRSEALELEVQDAGQGLAAEELAVVFEAYQTGSARPTSGERSTGLGLAIVKELVEAHRGVISVRSAVGHGSTFSVRLPLGSPDP